MPRAIAEPAVEFKAKKKSEKWCLLTNVQAATWATEVNMPGGGGGTPT